jgi:hypothetical protein
MGLSDNLSGPPFAPHVPSLNPGRGGGTEEGAARLSREQVLPQETESQKKKAQAARSSSYCESDFQETNRQGEHKEHKEHTRSTRSTRTMEALYQEHKRSTRMKEPQGAGEHHMTTTRRQGSAWARYVLMCLRKTGSGRDARVTCTWIVVFSELRCKCNVS